MNIEKKLEEVKREEKNKKSLLLMILGILTILFALIGASFAFFSTSVKGVDDAESFALGSTTIEGVTYQAKDKIALREAYPGDSAETQFTITNPNSAAVVRYTLKFIADLNEFTAVDGNGQLLITISGGELKSDVVLDFTDGENIKEQLITSNVELKTKESDVYNLKIEFVETEKNQNSNINKTFTGHIEINQSIVVQ